MMINKTQILLLLFSTSSFTIFCCTLAIFVAIPKYVPSSIRCLAGAIFKQEQTSRRQFLIIPLKQSHNGYSHYLCFYYLLHKKLLNYLLFNGILWLMRTIKATPQSHIVFVCIFRNAQRLFIGRQVWFQVVSFNLHTLKCILYIFLYSYIYYI